ncbi:MAG TPA: SOS response-associated peptidase [Terriglobia bacterium]|nr:SOS response-associated peptidase [Terriglobia bacterium]
MCGRAYQTYSDEELYFRYLNQRPITTWSLLPIYNLCPTHDSPVVRVVSDKRRIDLMRWQLVPSTEPAFTTKLSTINARSESVFETRLFRDLVVRQRCIVPLSGFYEWKRTEKAKQPFKIHLRNEPIMSVAGIWDTWHAGSPDERHSFSILTTSANDLMNKIHDRMPVILGRDAEEVWLDPNVGEREELEKLLKPCPVSWLTAVEVSPLVNSARNNSAELLRPVSPQPMPSRTPRLFD